MESLVETSLLCTLCGENGMAEDEFKNFQASTGVDRNYIEEDQHDIGKLNPKSRKIPQ